MEHEEERHVPRSHAEMFTATEFCRKCETVKDMGARMDGSFGEEGQKIQHDNLVLENRNTRRSSAGVEDMCTRMKDSERRKKPDRRCRLIF